MVLIDSYTEAYVSTSYNHTDINRHTVQTFQLPAGTDYYLTSAKLYLKYTTGNSFNYAFVLFATDGGTLGDTMRPTGSALETTSSAAGSTLSTSYALKELNFAGTTVLYGGTAYAIGAKLTSYTSGTMNVGIEGSGGEHAGRCCYSSTGTSWGAYGTEDMAFYVYGTAVSAAGSVKKTIATALISSTTGVNDTQ